MLPHHFEYDAGVSAVVAFAPTQADAAAHAIRVIRDVRYRTADMSADDVVAMRELTALADELGALSTGGGTDHLRASVARLGALGSVLAEFVTGEHLEREGDAQHLPVVYTLVDEIADLHAEALQAVVHGSSHAQL